MPYYCFYNVIGHDLFLMTFTLFHFSEKTIVLQSFNTSRLPLTALCLPIGHCAITLVLHLSLIYPYETAQFKRIWP